MTSRPRGLEAGIVTPTADDLADFYRRAFGFEVGARFELPEGIVVRLRSGGAGLKLFQPERAAGRPAAPEPWHRDAGFRYAALHVDDVEAVHRSVCDAGGSTLAEPRSHRPGARYALVADPEGNVWELLEEGG